MRSIVSELPRHLYVKVNSAFTHKEPCGMLDAILFALVSVPGRVWGCTVMLESGAVYRALPPHAIAFSDDAEAAWKISDAQRWDCYGYEFSLIEYPYLSGLDCLARIQCGREIEGSYLFTAVPALDGFSAHPEQSKEFSFIKLDNGRLTIQPTDHVVFRERSFTGDALSFPRGLRRSDRWWSCE